MKNECLTVTSVLLFSIAASSIVSAKERSLIITDPNQGHEIFKKALNDKNLDVLVDIYADDAIMVAVGGQEIRGKDAIRAFFTETVKIVDNFTFETVFRMNYKDTVVFRSKYTVVFNGPDGNKITQSTGGIEVLRKQADGHWLFVADHHFGSADYRDFLVLNAAQ
jgi:uncharacterized protein (TIGR02246 family)